ncbi:MAG: hypothetical protein RIR26_848 [Pseudomonadota bacterium]
MFQSQPWAEALRPNLHSLESLIGPARRLWDRELSTWRAGQRAHLVFWGPPGCGKTTLAFLLGSSQASSHPFRQLSAVKDGISEIKKSIELLHGGGILFIDEIHRLTRPQQDVLLPTLESGACWLLAATTENPSAVLSPALLSRIRTQRVHPPQPNELEWFFTRIMNDSHLVPPELLSQDKRERILQKWIPELARRCDGDVRLGLNLLEALFQCSDEVGEKDLLAGQLRAWTTSSHFDYASAMIKSMRGSDPDAALFYANAALAAGEDPLFLLRRCIVFASEDIGNADPAALRLSLDCFDAFQRVGMPEGRYAIAQAVCYLSATVKSNRILRALNVVGSWWETESNCKTNVAPPEHLVLKGHEKYRYPHDYTNSFVREQYLPTAIETLRSKMGAAYQPSDAGLESRLKERLIQLWHKEPVKGAT